MKKIFLMLVTILMVVCAFGYSACDNQPSGEKEIKTVTVTKDEELVSQLKSATEDIKVILAKGDYKRLTIEAKNYAVHLFSEDGARILGLDVADGVKNLTIEGIAFDSAGIYLGNCENVTIKNCKLSYSAWLENKADKSVKNLTVDGCSFKNVKEDKTSAIKIKSYETLTIKNSIFDNIEYDAIEVGATLAKGDVLIEGNSFSNIGSRVIELVSVENLESCTIDLNEFFDNRDSLLGSGAVDDGIKKSTGIYIHSESVKGAIDIGVNYWHSIPERKSRYISPLANYDINEQLLIGSK